MVELLHAVSLALRIPGHGVGSQVSCWGFGVQTHTLPMLLRRHALKHAAGWSARFFVSRFAVEGMIYAEAEVLSPGGSQVGM